MCDCGRIKKGKTYPDLLFGNNKSGQLLLFAHTRWLPEQSPLFKRYSVHTASDLSEIRYAYKPCFFLKNKMCLYSGMTHDGITTKKYKYVVPLVELAYCWSRYLMVQCTLCSFRYENSPTEIAHPFMTKRMNSLLQTSQA